MREHEQVNAASNACAKSNVSTLPEVVEDVKVPSHDSAC